jgi:hypothetical protein
VAINKRTDAEKSRLQQAAAEEAARQWAVEAATYQQAAETATAHQDSAAAERLQAAADEARRQQIVAETAALRQAVETIRRQAVAEEAAQQWAIAEEEARQHALAEAEAYLGIAVDESPQGVGSESRQPPATGRTFPRYYPVMERGIDNYWNIAANPAVYNDHQLWYILYEANKWKMKNPENPVVIEPGMVIEIPSINGERRSGTYDPKIPYDQMPKTGTPPKP